MMDNWNSFADWAMKGLIGGGCFYGIHILAQMRNSIDSLNQKVAKIIERTDWHSHEIKKLENRVMRLEDRRNG